MPVRVWDLSKAARLAVEHGVTRQAVTRCWREGRPVGERSNSSSSKTSDVNLALEVMVSLGASFPLTLQAIADVCGVSKEAIRLIERGALRRVRSLLADAGEELA